MTPLEAMAKAFWDSYSSVDTWDELSHAQQSRAIGHMRTALLFLAEVELPDAVRDAGLLDDAVPSEIFSAMLRSIAESKE